MERLDAAAECSVSADLKVTKAHGISEWAFIILGSSLRGYRVSIDHSLRYYICLSCCGRAPRL